ncbi:MAG: ABC transporter permease [Elusimicrobia bacterium]|nr:ABC transporter permease [Elusimicrobiota bacterium]
MNLLEGLRMGLIEMRSHKLRALLTLSGIAVGITSVVAMAGILTGMQKGMRAGLERVGMGRLFVTGKATMDLTRRSEGLTYADARAIREHFPDARVVSPSENDFLPLFYKDFRADMLVLGVTPEWAGLDWNYRVHGRFLNDDDMKSADAVCVLIKRLHTKEKDEENLGSGDDPLQPLFARYDPLGHSVRIGQTLFRVVGVLEELPKKDHMNVGEQNKSVLVPLTSFQKRIFYGSREIATIDVDSGSQASSYGLAKRLFAFLKRRHRGVEDFQVMNFTDFMGPFLKWFDMATVIFGAVAGIALFAGGVGIMNISLASVNARVKEIGIRKSLGARDRDIRRQFLIEAALLSLVGGVLGTALGGLLCLAVKLATPMTVILPAWAVLGALLVSILIGIVFSWYPARRASLLDPVVALRHE